MALTDKIPQDGNVLQMGPFEEMSFWFQDVSANLTILQTPDSSNPKVLVDRMSVDNAGKWGYAAGTGGAVTQITNRATGVTINTPTGTITTDNTSLAVEVDAVFIVTNSSVAIGDTVVVSIQSGTNSGNTMVHVVTVAAGSFSIAVANNNAAGGTAETGAILINYAVIKAVSS